MVVEDHPGVRTLLREWIASVFPDYRVVETTSGQEALVMAMTDPPMLVLMDDDLPLVNGVATTRRLKAANPQTTVVMLGAHEPARYRIASQMAGADAYVCKRTMHGELVPLLHRLLHDGVAGNDSPASGRPPLPEAR